MMNAIKKLRPYQQECLDTLRKRLKETSEPLLVNASVGAGKSLIIASLLHIIEKANWRALCLTMNSTLIQQNAETYSNQGGSAGIFCAGLEEKNTISNVIFGSPHSVAKAIRENHELSNVPFNLIIIDECHNIDHKNKKSMYMRILNHYGVKSQLDRYSYRIVGLTGTPYRGKSVPIVGKNEFFKEEVCSISTKWLIDNGFLVKPHFGNHNEDSFDMQNIKADRMGKFNGKALQDAIDKKERLTGKIMQEIVSFVESGRSGAFIFASTLKHADECMLSLPYSQSACITGHTSHEDRKKILEKAKKGDIKYLVNVATLLVGVDVPNFDICAWLRPTESLTLFTQGIGRVLRLSEEKNSALILDYAGNLERHGDLDDPFINDALQQEDENDPDYNIKCHDCGTWNKETSRRCIGVHDKKRCDHFFVFKACPGCEAMNDITARHCRECSVELIDPNKKLMKSDLKLLNVLRATYWVSVQGYTSNPIIHVKYTTNANNVFESYYTNSDKAQNYFYVNFIKHHIPNASKYYSYMQNLIKMKEMIEGEIKTPLQISCKLDNYNRLVVKKKIFNQEDCKTSE